MTDDHELITHVPSAEELAAEAGIKTERLGAEPLIIPPSQVLVPKEQAIQNYGINGDVLAVITLPKGDDEDVAKDIAIIDFGELGEGEKVPLHIIHGQEMGHATGYAKSRYGLYPLNYSAESPHFHAELQPDNPIVLGRNEHNHNAVLGLAHGQRGTAYTSREHLTVKLGSDGSIDLLDHSTHGTVIKYRDNTAQEPGGAEESHSSGEMNTEETLNAVAQALADVMKRRPDYFQNYDPKSPQESRHARIERELKALQQVLASGERSGTPSEVELFSGNQSRDRNLGREQQNNVVLEDLYSTFSQLAGRGLKDYYAIQEDAKAASANNMVVRADSLYKHLMDLPVMALTSLRNELSGVQLKLGPNVFATFTAENLFDEQRPHSAEVRLAVVPKR